MFNKFFIISVFCLLPSALFGENWVELRKQKLNMTELLREAEVQCGVRIHLMLKDSSAYGVHYDCRTSLKEILLASVGYFKTQHGMDVQVTEIDGEFWIERVGRPPRSRVIRVEKGPQAEKPPVEKKRFNLKSIAPREAFSMLPSKESQGLLKGVGQGSLKLVSGLAKGTGAVGRKMGRSLKKGAAKTAEMGRSVVKKVKKLAQELDRSSLKDSRKSVDSKIFWASREEQELSNIKKLMLMDNFDQVHENTEAVQEKESLGKNSTEDSEKIIEVSFPAKRVLMKSRAYLGSAVKKGFRGTVGGGVKVMNTSKQAGTLVRKGFVRGFTWFKSKEKSMNKLEGRKNTQEAFSMLPSAKKSTRTQDEVNFKSPRRSFKMVPEEDSSSHSSQKTKQWQPTSLDVKVLSQRKNLSRPSRDSLVMPSRAKASTSGKSKRVQFDDL